MLKWIILLCCLIPNICKAQDIEYGILAFSKHFDGKEHNEIHPMFQIEYKKRYVSSIYLNSANKVSLYGAYRIMGLGVLKKTYIEKGLVSGYRKDLTPTLRLGLEVNRYMDFVMMPASNIMDSPVLAIVVKIR